MRTVNFGKICQLSYYIINLFLFLLSLIIPKNKYLWVFGSRQGNSFAENSKYLFKYINEKHPEITAYWMTKNKKIYNQLKSSGYKCVYFHSIIGYWVCLRSKVFFVSHFKPSKYDVNYFMFNKNTIKIQLWHGSPIKKIIYDKKDRPFTDFEKSTTNKILSFLFPFHRYKLKFTKIIAASPIVAKNLATAFKMPEKDILITGYPKNDKIFSIKSQKDSKEALKIIYLPTFRDLDFDLFERYDFNAQEFNLFCKQNNVNFYIKLHPYSLAHQDNIIKTIKKCSHVKILNIDDIYEVLHEYDMLITDYSSIIFDYLLTNKPIIFSPFDLDEYLKNEVDLYYSYDQLCPGPKAFNWNEIMKNISDFIKNPNLFETERNKVKNEFNTYKDNNSSERIINEIKNII